MLGNLCGLRSGDGRGAGRRDARSSISGSCCAPKTWWRAAAPGTTNFAFHKVYHAVYDFATVDLSAVYFDVLKDRLYTSAPKSQARRSAQTALYRLLDALVRLLAPLLSFTAEEVWSAHGTRRTASTWRYFPEPGELDARASDDAARKRAANWDRLMEVRDDVLKSLETARKEKLIGAPLEARVRLSANGELYPLLEQYAANCRRCSSCRRWSWNAARGELARQVERAAGSKCERCWKYTHGCRQRRRVSRPSARRAPRPSTRFSMADLAAEGATEPRRLVFALDRLTKWIIETRRLRHRHAYR